MRYCALWRYFWSCIFYLWLPTPSPELFNFYWSFSSSLAGGDRPVTLINAHRFIKYAPAVWKIIFYAPRQQFVCGRAPRDQMPVSVSVAKCVCRSICVSGKSCNLMRQFCAPVAWALVRLQDAWIGRMSSGKGKMHSKFSVLNMVFV